MKKFFDFLERWLVESGLIHQLAYLVTKTSVIRGFVLWAAGALAIKGLSSEGTVSEAIVGVAVTGITGALTMFINHVRTKHNIAIQVAVGEVQDGFIGPRTVQTVETVVASSSGSTNPAP